MHQPVLTRIIQQWDCADLAAEADLAVVEQRLARANRRWPGLAQPSAYLAFAHRIADARSEALATSA